VPVRGARSGSRPLVRVRSFESAMAAAAGRRRASGCCRFYSAGARAPGTLRPSSASVSAAGHAAVDAGSHGSRGRRERWRGSALGDGGGGSGAQVSSSLLGLGLGRWLLGRPRLGPEQGEANGPARHWMGQGKSWASEGRQGERGGPTWLGGKGQTGPWRARVGPDRGEGCPGWAEGGRKRRKELAHERRWIFHLRI
jgi:hypothetical protein